MTKDYQALTPASISYSSHSTAEKKFSDQDWKPLLRTQLALAWSEMYTLHPKQISHPFVYRKQIYS